MYYPDWLLIVYGLLLILVISTVAWECIHWKSKETKKPSANGEDYA